MARSLALLILVAAVGFIIIQVIRFFLSINSSSGQKRRDIEQLKLGTPAPFCEASERYGKITAPIANPIIESGSRTSTCE